MSNKTWRKLDNIAKLFSLDDEKNTNIFRYSIILKHKVNKRILKQSVKMAINKYPMYQVKLKTGFFWNYFVSNKKDIIIEEEIGLPCKAENFSENNEYMFKVTYYKNKINLDVYHILTDGLGASIFLKEILYNYLDLKYKINNIQDSAAIFTQDEYLKNVNKKLICEDKNKKAYYIKEKFNILKNKTYHYILDLKKAKKVCKKSNVSISEYLTALYIYTIYKTIYDKKSKKDIIITVPIDLRKRYNIEALSNFFTCMQVEGNISNKNNASFNDILNQVHKEFKNKLTVDKVKKYLSRDVKLGSNIGIRLIPLFVKKTAMKYFNKKVYQSSTTTLSNMGEINIDSKYKKYIDNIIALVSASRVQKVKCTVCSFENNLTVTINSNLIDNKFEKEFYNLLIKHFGKVKLETNN